MKLSIFYSLLVFICLISCKVKTTKTYSCVSVSADRMNVIYKGIENPITVCATNGKTDSLSVELSHGSIRKSTVTGGYSVVVNNGNELKVSVYSLEPGPEKVLLGSYFFRLKSIPDPVPYVAMKTGSGEVSRAQLNATYKVFARMENLDFELNVNVIGYHFLTLRKDNSYYELDVDGDRITPAIKNIFQESKSGDRMIFDQIKVFMPDSTLRELGPVILKVKD